MGLSPCRGAGSTEPSAAEEQKSDHYKHGADGQDVADVIAGLAGGIAALTLTFLAYRALSHSLLALEWMPTLWVIGILALGGGLGGLASNIAVGRHLKEV